MKPYVNYREYAEKLDDVRWKKFSKKIRERDNEACVWCKSKGRLNAHHRAYYFVKRYQMFLDPWMYPENLLVTLCEQCHSKGHEKYKVPIKYI
jgi:5-methylcytosine-specific restriction endonuclease McrA